MTRGSKRVPLRRRHSENAPPVTPSDLTPAQHQFAVEYLSNGFNATAAYRAAHPNVTYATARMEGSRCLAHPCVRAFLDPQLQSRWKALQMDGDEALGRIALDARADLRRLFDEKGALLKPHEWPDDIANSIESVELRADGGVKVKLTGKLTARRIILEQTGKLKPSIANGVDAVAEAIRR